MDKKTKDLFYENYNNKGDCEELASYLVNVDKKNGILYDYLPWATVERIFRFQDGVIEHSPEIITQVSTGSRVLPSGEVFESKASFVKIKASWQGSELEELYPVFDSKGQSIAVPNQQDINRSKQRGMVRLVARISGIGLKLFEKMDLQFEKEPNIKVVEDVKSVEEPVTKPEKQKTVKPTKEPTKEPTLGISKEASLGINSMLNGEVIKPVEDVKPTEEPTEENADKVLETKKFIAEKKPIVVKHKQELIAYYESLGLTKVSELTLEQLKNKLKELGENVD